MVIDAVVSLASLIVPGLFDFAKKKFIKSENDTPERTMGSLATTKPEVLPAYTEALAKLYAAEVDYYNRDVVGTPGRWVTNLRAVIRPITVIAGLTYLGAGLWDLFVLDRGAQLFFESVISSWFGSKVTTESKS
jgi:hypothetical protein